MGNAEQGARKGALSVGPPLRLMAEQNEPLRRELFSLADLVGIERALKKLRQHVSETEPDNKRWLQELLDLQHAVATRIPWG